LEHIDDLLPRLLEGGSLKQTHHIMVACKDEDIAAQAADDLVFEMTGMNAGDAGQGTVLGAFQQAIEAVI
jgi:hypothetical protein